MKQYLILFIKGMSMGIANVIPGVSGGTIALITGIYEDLINSLKSFDTNSLKFITSLDILGFIKYTNLYFLIAVFGGSIASVFSIASLFKYLFTHYPILIWAFFFGLIIASIYFVGKRITKWNTATIISLVIGTGIALSLSFITPATENENLFFVFICGIIGISGMMLPGLSGSFILILMGNYELLMVTAVTELNLVLLGVFLLGSAFGLMSFSHILAWVFKHYKNPTLALLTGFILGSLSIIWPWKEVAESIIINGKEKIIAYNWYLPNELNTQTVLAILLIIIGVLSVYALENFAPKKD
ncbi:MAG: putative membrane protein [Flavobacteriales bacterium]|jgi:putative membrane protein